ncbi:ty3-gypsy retrotransposon protein [Cucumis melo var. makuwa]|uniref:Ty3-gypsy retrotransposon protein n=1 Tax=Cucumis melo var. makuwa TaxID=1194695 RepID=A0A5A7UHQ3_CUCMM|nr:ty3-gypsy retrotransposon protein [Cucumis melo var. makuwa]
MYQDLRRVYWLENMKREVADFISRCFVCQQVKAPRQKSAGLLQPLSVPGWKWESVLMDFITGLPKTLKGYSIIWVVVDRLMKSAHFIPGKSTYTAKILVSNRSSGKDFSLHWTRGSWDSHLQLMEFAYNNSYQAIIGMTPFQAGEGVLRFEKKGKLSPRFVGPFEILERVGPIAYRLALPPAFSVVHDVFHVSMLRNMLSHPLPDYLLA